MLFGGGGYPSLALAVAVPTPAHSPSQGDQVGPISPLPPTKAVPAPQKISSEASTILVENMGVCTWDKWSNKGEGDSRKGECQVTQKHGSKDSFTLMFPLGAGVSHPLSLSGTACRTLWGSLGLGLHGAGPRPPGAPQRCVVQSCTTSKAGVQ